MVVAYDDLHRSLLNAADSFACHASGSPTSRSYGRCLSWRHYTPTMTDSSLVADIFLPLYKYLLAAPFPCITILSPRRLQQSSTQTRSKQHEGRSPTKTNLTSRRRASQTDHSLASAHAAKREPITKVDNFSIPKQLHTHPSYVEVLQVWSTV